MALRRSTRPMSSALAATRPGKLATSRAWSPAETRSVSACSPRPRTSLPDRVAGVLRGPAQPPEGGAADPIHRALLRGLLHTRPSGSCWFATRTTTAAVHTASRVRACGRDLHLSTRSRKSRPAPPITRICRCIPPPRSARSPRDSPPATRQAAPRPRAESSLLDSRTCGSLEMLRTAASCPGRAADTRRRVRVRVACAFAWMRARPQGLARGRQPHVGTAGEVQSAAPLLAAERQAWG
jgi:hypothetical protein